MNGELKGSLIRLGVEGSDSETRIPFFKVLSVLERERALKDVERRLFLTPDADKVMLVFIIYVIILCCM